MKHLLYEKRREHLGVLLQRERKCQHIDQTDIARKLGVRQELISKIEANKRRIDIIELISYCEALNLTLTEFAWKIETYFHAEGLLPPPKINIQKIKIGVEVSWRENNFSATYREIVPKTVVFTANTFADLREEARNTIKRFVNAVEEVVSEAPWWIKNEKYEFEYIFLDVQSLLKVYSPYISLAVISKTSDINPSLLSQYANGLKKASPEQLKRITDAINKIVKEIPPVVL